MPVLALYSGLLGLIFIALSYKVVKHRKQFEIGIGDGDNKDLGRSIRVQANFTEYVPMALVLLAVFEYNKGDLMVAHACGILLVLARLLHAYGLGKTVRTSFGRFVGVLLTWVVTILLSGFNIYYFLLTHI